MSVFDVVQSYFYWEKSTSVTFTVAQNCEKNSKAEYQYSGPLLFFKLMYTIMYTRYLNTFPPKKIKLIQIQFFYFNVFMFSTSQLSGNHLKIR